MFKSPFKKDTDPSMSKDLKLETNSEDVVEVTDLSEGTTIDNYSIDAAVEKRLVRKFDFHILPVLAVMYLFNSLDKSNLGNAKTATLVSDLHLKPNDYNTLVAIFFVPYVLTAPFLGILGKKYGPSRVLPIMMFCFGILTICVTAVQNFSGLFAIRWFLGMSESAFFPLVIFYQTTFVFFLSNSNCLALTAIQILPAR